MQTSTLTHKRVDSARPCTTRTMHTQCRAVLKAGPILSQFDYDTGLPEEDAQTRRLIDALVRVRARESESERERE